MFVQKDFEIETVLHQPLMAHLSTVDQGTPRDSPVWFIWEESSLWIFGTTRDSFVKRLQKEPQCAVGGQTGRLGCRFIAFCLRSSPDKALMEFLATSGYGVEYIAYNAMFEGVAVRITHTHTSPLDHSLTAD